MSLDYFTDIFLRRATEGLSQELKTQTMDVKCYTQPSPGCQHLDFICKNVIDTYGSYTVSLQNIVLSITKL